MSEVVYVIDDDDAFRDSLVWLLESSQYAVHPFGSAEAFWMSRHHICPAV